MNKEEKKLYKKIESIYRSVHNTEKSFTRDENLIIDRWISNGILHKDAFSDTTAFNDSHKLYIQKLGYPFTTFGEAEYKKDWYLQFRSSKGAVVIRDLFVAFSFLASLYLTITKILEN